jgi:hypothetical protein
MQLLEQSETPLTVVTVLASLVATVLATSS